MWRKLCSLNGSSNEREKGEIMRRTTKSICSLLLAVMFILLSAQSSNVDACSLPPSEWRFSPKVLIGEVTENTTSVPVYVFKDTTLYIKNGSKVVYKKFYANEGLKNVKIKKQRGRSKLKFYLIAEASGKSGDVVTRRVTKLPIVAPEKESSSIQKPIVQKRITSETTNVQVRGRKNTTLVIKNEKKTLKKVEFKTDGKKQITIPAQKKGTLYFYLKKGNRRGKVVSRKIKDVTAPKMPEVKISYSQIKVKGEVGTKIYLKGSRGWEMLGVVLEKKWNTFQAGLDYFNTRCEYYEIYLKDAAGNKSEKVRIKNPEPGPPPNVSV